MAKRPKQSDTLLNAFRRAVETDTVLQFASDGIGACLDNAISLRQDFLVLVQGRRFPAAQFMYATAMEEIGKALILLDTVRTNFNDEFLPHFCRAFYAHVSKFAYARTMNSPGRGDLAAALELYRIETIPYWTNSDPEDFEPDMIATGLYARESALYVDYVEYDKSWFRPVASSLARLYADPEQALFAKPQSTTGENEIASLLEPLERARVESLFSVDALQAIKDEFAGTFCTSGCDSGIRVVIERLGQRLDNLGINVSEGTLQANFMKFPLYAMIVAPQRVPSY